MKILILFQRDFWKKFLEHLIHKDVFFNASAITFNLFIFFVPFALLMVSIVGFILSHEAAMSEISRYASEYFPGLLQENVEHSAVVIERFVNPIIQRRGFFGIIGFGILVLTSLALFSCLKHVLFQVFDLEDRANPFKEMVYNFFVFGLIGGVFIFFSMVLSALSVITFNEINIPYTEISFQVDWAFELFTLFVPLFITFLLFFVIFRFLTERKISLDVAVVGAFTYTFLFEVAKYAVSIYFDYAFRTYQNLYQSYTFLIILSVWVFYTAALFVISSTFAKAYMDTELDEQWQFIKQKQEA